MTDFDFKIPFLGAIINYIYDFCTYRRNWTMRLHFERYRLEDNTHYFSIRCINQTSYNIKLTKIYIKDTKKKATLKVGQRSYNNSGIAQLDYINIEHNLLNDEYTNINLSHKDTDEIRDYMEYDTNLKIRNNEARIEVSFSGEKTELFIEYEIKDIISSFLMNIIGFGNLRQIKVVIPI